MGDRCQMTVWCLKENVGVFEELGFEVATPWDRKVGPSQEYKHERMEADECNYALSEEMPTDIPYYSEWGSGSSYGPGFYVCDGKEFFEQETGNDRQNPTIEITPNMNDEEIATEVARIRELEVFVKMVRQDILGEELVH